MMAALFGNTVALKDAVSKDVERADVRMDCGVVLSMSATRHVQRMRTVGPTNTVTVEAEPVGRRVKGRLIKDVPRGRPASKDDVFSGAPMTLQRASLMIAERRPLSSSG